MLTVTMLESRDVPSGVPDVPQAGFPGLDPTTPLAVIVADAGSSGATSGAIPPPSSGTVVVDATASGVVGVLTYEMPGLTAPPLTPGVVVPATDSPSVVVPPGLLPVAPAPKP